MSDQQPRTPPMTPYDSPDWLALVAGIRADPTADLIRLVAADWLDDHGEDEYGEFIRLQCQGHTGDTRLWELLHSSRDWFSPVCEITGNLPDDWGVCRDGSVHYKGKYRYAEFWVRRGFVAEVRAPLAWLVGGPCERCSDARTRVEDRHEFGTCLTCQGTGRTPDHLRDIRRRHPVEVVTATDRSPFHMTAAGAGIEWWTWVEDPRSDMRHWLPPDIHGLLSGNDDSGGKRYRSEDAARVALSDALLAWARPVPVPVRPYPVADFTPVFP